MLLEVCPNKMGKYQWGNYLRRFKSSCIMKIGSNNHNMIGIPGWCPYRNGFCKEASIWKAEIIDVQVDNFVGKCFMKIFIQLLNFTEMLLWSNSKMIADKIVTSLWPIHLAWVSYSSPWKYQEALLGSQHWPARHIEFSRFEWLTYMLSKNINTV